MEPRLKRVGAFYLSSVLAFIQKRIILPRARRPRVRNDRLRCGEPAGSCFDSCYEAQCGIPSPAQSRGLRIGLNRTPHRRTFLSKSVIAYPTLRGTQSAIANAMAREIIPWHVFLEAFRKQPKARLDEWLAKWCFGEQGAFLLDVPVKPEDAQRRRLENAVAELIFHQPMRQPTFH